MGRLGLRLVQNQRVNWGFCNNQVSWASGVFGGGAGSDYNKVVMWTSQKFNLSTRDWIGKEGEIPGLNLNLPELIMNLQSVVVLIVFSCKGIIGPVSHKPQTKERRIWVNARVFIYYLKSTQKGSMTKGGKCEKLIYIRWEVAWSILNHYTYMRLRDFPV